MGCDNQFTVFSKDDDGNTIQAKAFNARKTGIDKELVEIEFEDGLKIKVLKLYNPSVKALTAYPQYQGYNRGSYNSYGTLEARDKHLADVETFESQHRKLLKQGLADGSYVSDLDGGLY